MNLTPASFSFAVLGSGSGGNCAVLRWQGELYLIDAGLSSKQIVLRLELLGLKACDVRAIILTHEHSDHVRGIDVFCKSYPVPIYCNAATRHAIEPGLKYPKQWQIFQTGGSFSVESTLKEPLQVQSFSVPHDAADPVGYCIRCSAGSLGVLSDVGFITNLIKEYLRGVDTLFIEANFDEQLLEQDMRRPWATKQRIRSRHGHLSNEQSANLVAEIFPDAKRRPQVVLGHLSSDCNTAELARQAVIEVMSSRVEVKIEVAKQKEATELLSIIQDTDVSESEAIAL